MITALFAAAAVLILADAALVLALLIRYSREEHIHHLDNADLAPGLAHRGHIRSEPWNDDVHTCQTLGAEL